jgi:hypothetical protein
MCVTTYLLHCTSVITMVSATEEARERSDTLVGVNIKITIFCDVKPCSLVFLGNPEDNGGSFIQIYKMPEHFSTKKIDATSSETLVCIYQNIWRQVPDDRNIN